MYYWTDPAQGWDEKKAMKIRSAGVFYVIEAEGSMALKLEKGDKHS